MDIKSFRVEGNELVVTIGVRDAGDALGILQSLRFTKVASQPAEATAILKPAVKDRPEAMQAAAAGAPVLVPAPAEVAAPAPTEMPAPVAAAPAQAAPTPIRRGPGRPRKTPVELVAPKPAPAPVADPVAPELIAAAKQLDDEDALGVDDDGIEADIDEEEEDLDDEGDGVVEAPAPAPVAVRAQPKAAPAAVAETVKPLLRTGDTQVLIAKLVEFTKLKDVLYTLKDSGYTTANQLADVCEELQKDVPVLSRITGLRDRVQRAVQVLGL